MRSARVRVHLTAGGSSLRPVHGQESTGRDGPAANPIPVGRGSARRPGLSTVARTSYGGRVTVSERRTDRPGEDGTAPIELVDGTWQVRALPLVRQVLREQSAHQAGFAAEVTRDAGVLTRLPVLFEDGERHREQRTAIARYFAPAVVDRRYRALMEERADDILSRLDGGQPVDLSVLTLHFSTQVAARVVGLTESDAEVMGRRLTGFFDQPASMRAAEPPTGLARVTSFLQSLPAMARLGVFYRQDVLPAIRARRAQRQEDVISHLLDQDYSSVEILMECLTYAAAGMATTREFLQITTWHLLERPDLRRRFLDGDQAARAAVLHETLRLEPVVGHLYRRATADLHLVATDGTAHHVPAGARLDLHIRSANADPEQLGADALLLRPGRDLPPGIRPEVMSFGDGAHRCPGNALAMTESEIFLTRLLSRDLELVSEPRLEWEDLIAGYAVRGLTVRDTGSGTWTGDAPGAGDDPVPGAGEGPGDRD